MSLLGKEEESELEWDRQMIESLMPARLNSSATSFINSIKELVDKSIPLTERQLDTLYQIYNQFM